MTETLGPARAGYRHSGLLGRKHIRERAHENAALDDLDRFARNPVGRNGLVRVISFQRSIDYGDDVGCNALAYTEPAFAPQNGRFHAVGLGRVPESLMGEAFRQSVIYHYPIGTGSRPWGAQESQSGAGSLDGPFFQAEAALRRSDYRRVLSRQRSVDSCCVAIASGRDHVHHSGARHRKHDVCAVTSHYSPLFIDYPIEGANR